MNDAHDYLTEVEARADAATDGPWDCEDCEGDIQVNAGTARTEWKNGVGRSASSWRVDDRILEYEVESWDEGEDAQDDQMRRNAEFIAHSRADVPRMTAALRAMLDLAEWHETKAEKARLYPGADAPAAMEKAAQVHDDAARRIRRTITEKLEVRDEH
ncbi:hypothetical protein [Zhihengliuella flava]|uniref:Uncharacterized protein n=1 Tax=Zhihengliuella flava TaxID=1285193 RepID=A0A931D3V2_9MICC|nr:hypothetical protein [Zhihengliuella flava]MBG6083260.1 hypothetical protein [Zhihengliuella flava]